MITKIGKDPWWKNCVIDNQYTVCFFTPMVFSEL